MIVSSSAINTRSVFSLTVKPRSFLGYRVRLRGSRAVVRRVGDGYAPPRFRNCLRTARRPYRTGNAERRAVGGQRRPSRRAEARERAFTLKGSGSRTAGGMRVERRAFCLLAFP